MPEQGGPRGSPIFVCGFLAIPLSRMLDFSFDNVLPLPYITSRHAKREVQAEINHHEAQRERLSASHRAIAEAGNDQQEFYCPNGDQAIGRRRGDTGSMSFRRQCPITDIHVKRNLLRITVIGASHFFGAIWRFSGKLLRLMLDASARVKSYLAERSEWEPSPYYKGRYLVALLVVINREKEQPYLAAELQFSNSRYAQKIERWLENRAERFPCMEIKFDGSLGDWLPAKKSVRSEAPQTLKKGAAA